MMCAPPVCLIPPAVLLSSTRAGGSEGVNVVINPGIYWVDVKDESTMAARVRISSGKWEGADRIEGPDQSLCTAFRDGAAEIYETYGWLRIMRASQM